MENTLNNNFTDKEKWENIFYYVEAKKSLESLLYLRKHISELHTNISFYDFVQSKISHFILNLSFISDYYFSKQEEPKKKKKEWIARHKEIERIYYLRDKNYAHKDKDFEYQEYKNLDEIIDKMYNLLSFYLKIFKNKNLKVDIEFNFVCYDKFLYRFINNITKEKEEEIYNIRKRIGNELKITNKKFNQQKNISKKIVKSYSYFEQLKNKNIENNEEYGVVFEYGLSLSECYQNCLESCIRSNFLFGTKMYWSLNDSNNLKYKKDFYFDFEDFDKERNEIEKNIIEKLKDSN